MINGFRHGFGRPKEARERDPRRKELVVDSVEKIGTDHYLKAHEMNGPSVFFEVEDPATYKKDDTLTFTFRGIRERGGQVIHRGTVETRSGGESEPADVETRAAEELWPDWFGDPAVGAAEAGEGEEKRSIEEQVIPEGEVERELHTVRFSRGGLYAYVDGEKCRIENASELFLLPGDEVSVELTGEKMRTGEPIGKATDVRYAGRATVLGRFKYEGDSIAARRSGERKLQFVVRVAGHGGRLDKFRFDAGPVIAGMSEEQIQKLVDMDGYLKFDRSTKKVVGDTVWADEEGSYGISRLALLTNLGIEQHDEEAELVKRGGAEQLQALQNRFNLQGIDEKNQEDLATRAAPAMEALITRAAKAKRIEDFRGGGRHTFAVDSEKTRIRDDAFSIGPSKEGPEWREIGIHIADPRLLVRAGSAIDRATAQRAVAISLPEELIPLYPRLITALGSLDQDFDRRAYSLVFDARLDADKGVVIKNPRFTPSAIRVTSETTPENADKMLRGADVPSAPGAAEAWKELSAILGAVDGRVGRAIGKTRNSSRIPRAVETVSIANGLFNRMAARGFSRLKRSFYPRLKKLEDMVVAVYEHRITGDPGQRSQTETATTPDEGRSSLGQTSYLSSPLRSYTSLLGMRSLGFLGELAARAKAKQDVSPKAYRKLVEQYATDIVGMPLSPEVRALPDDEFAERVAADAQKFLDGVLKRVVEREAVVGRIARAGHVAKLLDNVGSRILQRGPFTIPDGLTLSFVDERQEPSMENGVPWVYAEAQVSREINTSLYGYAAKNAGRLTVQVKFPLPPGVPFPKAPAVMHADANALDVDLDANRLTIEIENLKRAELPSDRDERQVEERPRGRRLRRGPRRARRRQ